MLSQQLRSRAALSQYQDRKDFTVADITFTAVNLSTDGESQISDIEALLSCYQIPIESATNCLIPRFIQKTRFQRAIYPGCGDYRSVLGLLRIISDFDYA